METYDKYKWCKNPHTGEHCPDRFPGCHDDCTGYQSRHEKNMERLRKEKENRWRPTEHHTKVVIAYYKKQKKAKIFKG